MTPMPKMVILDIETSHDILASYGLREQYHSPDNILADWYIICCCWKWYGGKRIYSASVLDDMKRFKKNCADDYVVVKAMHELLSDVEIVIGHNVSKFDWKKFYGRVMYYRLDALDKPLFIDTLKEARKLAAFTSNTMKYLAKYFGITPKMEHSRGMGLEILKGNVKATEECIQYCKGDIVTSEELYERIKPYMENHPNMGLWRGDGIECCRNCSSTSITLAGTRTTMAGRYQRYKCEDCGSYMRGKKMKGVRIR